LAPDPAGFAGVFEPYRIDCGGAHTLFAFNSPQVGAPNFAQNPPVYFEQNLRTAVGIARIHNIRLMLSTFAYWADGTGLVGYYRTGMDEHNAIIRALAAEYDLPWVDYAALASQDPAQWTDYIHFSPEGTRAQAAAYAAYIDRQGMIPRDLARVDSGQ
jgi:hypothetical protein